MEREITQLYQMLEQLRRLRNTLNQEPELDTEDLRRGMNYLNQAYEELVAYHQKKESSSTKVDIA